MQNQEREESKFIPQIQRSRDEEGHRFFDELESILTRRIEEVKSTPQEGTRFLTRNGGHWIFMR